MNPGAPDCWGVGWGASRGVFFSGADSLHNSSSNNAIRVRHVSQAPSTHTQMRAYSHIFTQLQHIVIQLKHALYCAKTTKGNNITMCVDVFSVCEHCAQSILPPKREPALPNQCTLLLGRILLLLTKSGTVRGRRCRGNGPRLLRTHRNTGAAALRDATIYVDGVVIIT